MKNPLLLLTAILLVLSQIGCVERLLTIHSEPAGAVVWLNGEEVGVTPLTTSFTWYGTYEVLLRKDGCQPMRIGKKINAPIYQWPVIDLAAECLVPFTFKDHHLWTFELKTRQNSDPNALIDRARELREVSLLSDNNNN